MGDLNELYRDLMDLTEAHISAQAALSQAERAMLDSQAGIEYQAQKAGAAEIDRQRQEIDRQLRSEALALYQAHPEEKHLHPKVSIRVNLVAEHMADSDAMEWAKAHPDIPGLVIPAHPDWRRIEKAARAMMDIGVEVPCVRWREQPVVAISLDDGE